ncbi:hypothetical protein MUG91_G8n79 [Manis pentadactyla]|nr:hypothetical protein MUG91_G8n79 [Manis pentadactyla]
MSICNVADSDKGPVNMAKCSRCKSPITTSSWNRKTRSCEQEKTKRTRKRNSKKAEEGEQSGNKVTAEEKPTIPRMKWKKNQPEFSQDNFKEPRSRLGMHTLESVQVFQALGKKIDKKPRFSSSQTLGNSRNHEEPQPLPATKPWLNTLREGKSPEKTHVKTQKPDGSITKECPSPSQDELPPSGKVKLVPLPFLISTNSTQPDLTNSTQPSVTQSAASRPVPYRASSCTFLQQEPIPTAVPQHQSPPKPQTQLPPQEFCFQPHSWRKPDISGPEMSKPITEEQRPEQEAMRRRAQQERENAAKSASLGKIQFFIEREKEMEIADSYGYVM